VPILISSIFSVDSFLPFMVFAIPIVAIVGGITASIVKTVTDAKMMENAQRERLAAIQRGIDLDKLPPLPVMGGGSTDLLAGFNPIAAQHHRAQGLLIAGVITLFAGIGIGAFLYFIVDSSDSDRVWAVGIIPVFIGLALLLSSAIVWPKGDKAGTGT
jgi:hypothetical protein